MNKGALRIQVTECPFSVDANKDGQGEKTGGFGLGPSAGHLRADAATPGPLDRSVRAGVGNPWIVCAMGGIEVSRSH